MRKLTFFIALCSLIYACGNAPEGKAVQEIKPTKVSNSEIIRNPVTANQITDTVNVAKFEFEETEYDFGTILEGRQVKHVFKFKNVGKVPLVISDARSTCGCTVPEWPKDPVPPGGSGEISVNFNTTRKLKDQVKPVKITANTYPSKTTLKLKGYVHPLKENGSRTTPLTTERSKSRRKIE